MPKNAVSVGMQIVWKQAHFLKWPLSRVLLFASAPTSSAFGHSHAWQSSAGKTPLQIEGAHNDPKSRKANMKTWLRSQGEIMPSFTTQRFINACLCIFLPYHNWLRTFEDDLSSWISWWERRLNWRETLLSLLALCTCLYSANNTSWP